MAEVAVAAEGGRLQGLCALRDTLASAVDGCDSKRDLAALSQRLMDVLEQIEVLEKAQPAREGTALDEFTRRRAARQTSRPSRAAGGR